MPQVAQAQQSITPNLDSAIPAARQALGSGDAGRLAAADSSLQAAYQADVRQSGAAAVNASPAFRVGDQLSDQLQAETRALQQRPIGGKPPGSR